MESLPVTTPLGYQVAPPPSDPNPTRPWESPFPSPFDIAGIAAAIDRASSSLAPDDRGSVTVQLTREGFGAGLVVRGPFGAQALATVTKPAAGRWGWSLSGRVAFLAGVQEGPKPVRIAPELRGLYRLFRAAANGRARAAAKAIAASLGLEVPLRAEGGAS